MQLVRYEAMRAAIAAAASVDEAKDIADKATALAAYARQSKDPELERQVAEIRLRAKRRIGELSAALDRGAGRPSEILPTHGKNFKASALAAANLSTSEANRCEKLASIPVESFERYLAEKQTRWSTSTNGSLTGTPCAPEPLVPPEVDLKRREKQEPEAEPFDVAVWLDGSVCIRGATVSADGSMVIQAEDAVRMARHILKLPGLERLTQPSIRAAA